MLADVLAQPHQVGDALWRVESARIERADLVGGLLVCGMGGSAIGGDLGLAILGDRATRPVRTVRDYAPEPWLGPDTLVLCASYSGDTEETLACFEAAAAAGSPRVVLTTGGGLAEAARAEGVPVIGVPSGMQPRAAVVYMTVAALECACACGAGPALRHELELAAELLGRLAKEWSENGEPELVAQALHGTVPVVLGAGPTAAPALRWKTQLNENAKVAAFAAVLPEADHNEICGWERGRAAAPLAAVFLEDDDHHERLRRRVDLTAAEAERAGAPVLRLRSRGRTPAERVLSLVLLGDLASVRLAALDGIDPTPIEPIERLKTALR
jgi:glucose/mannose-6-phosphate isomerase